jgi:tyrosine-specific transport protein
MSRSKILGGLLLIIGTSIGGGMLALPVSTADIGFAQSIFYLVFCWIIMTSGALLILEVNLRLPAGANMISMAQSTLGLPGQIVAWVAYLLLLYTLLAGYISGGSDVFNALFSSAKIPLPPTITPILFTAIFGVVVYHGIQSVDFLNRGLMLAKLGTYLLLIFLISPHIQWPTLKSPLSSEMTGGLMVLVTSFGFASIVPSLRSYFHDDSNTLRQVIIFGSLIPLMCYIIWDAVIMGVIPHDTLTRLIQSNTATSDLTKALNTAIHTPWITSFFSFFTAICMLTAVLGVSLGLFDFLADGLKLQKKGLQGYGTLSLTFIPPLILVLFNPGLYLNAMQYAGVCCIILLLLLPAMMAWQSRRASPSADHPPLVPFGNTMLIAIILFSMILLKFAWN